VIEAFVASYGNPNQPALKFTVTKIMATCDPSESVAYTVLLNFLV